MASGGAAAGSSRRWKDRASRSRTAVRSAIAEVVSRSGSLSGERSHFFRVRGPAGSQPAGEGRGAGGIEGLICRGWPAPWLALGLGDVEQTAAVAPGALAALMAVLPPERRDLWEMAFPSMAGPAVP